MASDSRPMTYAEAGVDVAAGDRAVELMRSAVARTHGPEVVGGFGGFAGLFDVSALKSYDRPLLASSTDGVGTKVAIAQAMDRHDTIGTDLVAMVVDDIVVCGARPLVMTDYIATGRVVPDRIADIVRGIADACLETGTALVGGETAEHPDLLGPNEYDVAGAAVGVVEADRLLGAHRVQPGDVVIGMAASGLHANGYSLVRRVIRDAGWALNRYVPELGRTLGDELLEPTRLYTSACLALADDDLVGVRAFSHITGGGLAANLSRVLPAGTDAVISRAAWRVLPIFEVLRELGTVSTSDLERTFNLGLGMVAIVDPKGVESAVQILKQNGHDAMVIGQVAKPGSVDLYLANEVWDPADLQQGAKGVDGGRVLLVDRYSELG